jgi:hypothetical protein
MPSHRRNISLVQAASQGESAVKSVPSDRVTISVGRDPRGSPQGALTSNGSSCRMILSAVNHCPQYRQYSDNPINWKKLFGERHHGFAIHINGRLTVLKPRTSVCHAGAPIA